MTQRRPAEPFTDGLGLFFGAAVVGPLIGFFGPIGVLVLAEKLLENPSDNWIPIAVCAPFAYGGWLVVRPVTRAWGIAVLVGTAGGFAVLLSLVHAAFSSGQFT